MHVIHARNVCDALPEGVLHLLAAGLREDSRNGPVLVAPTPVTTVYVRPQERVLTSPVRDANPFFSLAESLWMLAGRQDSGFLDNFVRDFGARFADNGVVHGAYGRRWRESFGVDQLDAIVAGLRVDPGSRQAVLQMWDCRNNEGESFDFGDRCEDLHGKWRDRPCNTHCYLRVRGIPTTETTYRGAVSGGQTTIESETTRPSIRRVLDLTVLCRSNDIIWGAYGANAVHFSVLQEYLAARIGVGVGVMYQVSNNFHAYASELGRLEARMAAADYPYTDLVNALRDGHVYVDPAVRPQPLVDDPESFDREVKWLLNIYESLGAGTDAQSTKSLACQVSDLSNGFLGRTAWPMLMAHRVWRAGAAEALHTTALEWVAQVQAPDWRTAAREWIERRTKK